MNNLLKDVGDMVIFAAVVQAGSITHGADRLGLERTTVSRRIKNFETNLGVKLLNRSTKRVTATDLGKQCYRHSLQVIRASEDAAAAARGQTVLKPLIVGAPLVVIESLLQPMLKKFLNIFSSMDIEFEVYDSWSPIIAPSVDLFVHVGNQLEATSEFRVQEIGPTRQLIVTSPAYRRKIASTNDPSVAQGYRWIAYGDSQELISVRLAGEMHSGEVLIAPKSCVPNMSTAREAAAAALGVCVLPAFACEDLIKNGTLVCCLGNFDVPDADVSIVTRNSSQPHRVKSSFIDFLSQSFMTCPN